MSWHSLGYENERYGPVGRPLGAVTRALGSGRIGAWVDGREISSHPTLEEAKAAVERAVAAPRLAEVEKLLNRLRAAIDPKDDDYAEPLIQKLLALLGPAGGAANERSKAENLLLGLHKVVSDLGPYFDKPVTEETMPRWLALDSAQKAVAAYFAVPAHGAGETK